MNIWDLYDGEIGFGLLFAGALVLAYVAHELYTTYKHNKEMKKRRATK